jgi:TonB family protein
MALNLLFIVWISIFGNTKEETIPEFKGGQKSLNSFIARNLIYPEYSKQNCIEGTVQISFKLTSTGNIFGSKIQKGYGVDIDDEALRIVRLTTGRWIVPSPFDTTQAIVIPINFSLKEYNCHQRSKEDIKEAITAFKAQQNLTQAIVNFYDKKSSRAYSAADEAKIVDLKRQLGYDEKYFKQLLKRAQQKLKQGDKDGACEDFNFIRKLGSDKAKAFIANNCKSTYNN